MLLIGGIILSLLSGDASTLTINGEPVTGYRHMLPVLHVVINTVICLLAVVMSLSTIPEDFFWPM